MMKKKPLVMIAAFVAMLTFGTVTAEAADYNSSNNRWTTITKTSHSYIPRYTTYTKFKAKATGRLIVKGVNFYGYVSLCNAKKKTIATDDFSACYFSSNSAYKWQRSVTFGVKKNVTYYIKSFGNGDNKYSYDNNTMTSTYRDTYRLMPVNTKISGSSGSKKSKAKTLKKNKTKKGVIVAGSSKANWYKFKLTKRKNIKFYLNGGVNSSIKVTILKKGDKSFNYPITLYRANEKRNVKVYVYKKGTYYVKVQRKKAGSGWYSLKWK